MRVEGHIWHAFIAKMSDSVVFVVVVVIVVVIVVVAFIDEKCGYSPNDVAGVRHQTLQSGNK